MTEQETSLTPHSDAVAHAQDEFARALYALAGNTPEAKALIEAQRTERAAFANALTASQAGMMGFLDKFLADFTDRIRDEFKVQGRERRQQTKKLADKLDKLDKSIADRMHTMSNRMQAFVDMQFDQAQLTTELEERIDGQDQRIDTNTASIVQIRREIRAIYDHLGMPYIPEALIITEQDDAS